jgi:ABC-type branched-subunit amino acid transport system ATPase component
MTLEPRLQCRNLVVKYGEFCALKGVSGDIQGPGVTGIVGPKGAGKTTLLNAITGFLRPESGEISLNARPITRLPPYRVARLGIARTFQDVRITRQVPVLENVMLAHPSQRGEKLLYAVTRVGVAKQEAENLGVSMELLRFVGLAEKANELAGELSYGQQKLLSLACCLATQAHILLLDEPIAGVHPGFAEQILNLLVQLKAQGKLVVFIEHDLSAVRKIADTVIVMDEGRVIAKGSPQDVLARPEIMEAFVA